MKNVVRVQKADRPQQTEPIGSFAVQLLHLQK